MVDRIIEHFGEPVMPDIPDILRQSLDDVLEITGIDAILGDGAERVSGLVGLADFRQVGRARTAGVSIRARPIGE